MRLNKVKIKNFRCFGPAETVIDFENLTAIIGTNSSGKTALLNMDSVSNHYRNLV